VNMASVANDRQRSVLVTGAAKRIGRVIALDLAQHGFRVAIHYQTSRKEAEDVARACGGAPLFKADLTKVSEIRRMFSEVDQQIGLLDGLVNNAARFTRFDPLDVTEADWDFIHDVNLKAVFFCCQEAARRMKASGSGRIVNISSLGGLRPWAQHAHYCASKAGLIMLTQALAKAFAPEITVNSVAPGVVSFGDTDQEARSMIAATPMRRAGKPEEIAEAVRFFLTASDFITGQILAVDGGLEHR
jgi:NAD(P)-dependent dehydrogenase (short-subunit alcohol dehydrogenase family)